MITSRRDSLAHGSAVALTGRYCIRMLIRMRTTLVLDDELLRKAKRLAAERDTTVSDVVNEALRELFGRPRPQAAPFTMITYGRGSRRVHHEPADFARALDDEDRDGLG
jgi:hypothetical protein